MGFHDFAKDDDDFIMTPGTDDGGMEMDAPVLPLSHPVAPIPDEPAPSSLAQITPTAPTPAPVEE